MNLKLWQVDAFAQRRFQGNPAAVVPLEEWLSDATLQAIAAENNLSETAFLVARAPGNFGLRWFTPTIEVPLCGHATLASAWVVLNEFSPQSDVVRFQTKSGELTVRRGGDGGRLQMSLPSGRVEPFAAPQGFAKDLGQSMGVAPPSEIHIASAGAAGMPGILAIWPEADVRSMRLSGMLVDVLARAGAAGLIATAKGDGAPYDFVSRFFVPGKGVPEDPVTGSAHASLTPFWAKRLGKRTPRAYQASARGGDLLCSEEGERVTLSGRCALYLKGEIEI